MIKDIIKSGISKIFVETDEPGRVYQFIPALDETNREIVAEWKNKKGIAYQVTENKSETIKCTENIDDALNFLVATRKKYLILLFGAPDYDLLQMVPDFHTTIFVAESFQDFPGAVKVSLPQPTLEEYENAFQDALLPKRNKALAQTCAVTSSGMRVADATNCFKYSLFSNTEFLHNRHKFVNAEIIEYVDSPYTFKDLGGFLDFKQWFNACKFLYRPEAKKYGLSLPRGVVLSGGGGIGKSLCAKTLGNEAELPLIRFDLAKVYNQYVGQSETNLYKALRSMEQAAPAIVWIEELGRLTVGKDSDGDSGTTSRLLAILLTWLQEHDKDIFVVATVNDIENIPKELLRKGRFSKIIDVPMPDTDTRREIWEIHLNRHNIPIRSRPTLIWMAEKTAGMTGADIEARVIDTMITAYNLGLEKQYIVAEHFIGEE